MTTYGSNGKMYVYRYSGGDDQRGNLKLKHADGPDIIIPIALSAAVNFKIIDDVQFTDNDGQLTGPVEGNGRAAHIHDKNSGPLNTSYALKIHDSNTPSGDIYFDPGIINN